jgi:hypothetical protein
VDVAPCANPRAGLRKMQMAMEIISRTLRIKSSRDLNAPILAQ